MARIVKRKSGKRKSSKKRSAVKPGFTRVGGYYGRYNGTPGWEKKWFDTDIPATPVPGAGSVFPTMNLVQQNAAQNGRIGRKIVITNLAFNYYFTKFAQASFLSTRVLVVLDKQANGAPATMGDVLENPGDLTSYYNLANSQRFSILYDKYNDISSYVAASWTTAGATATVATSLPVSKHFKWSKRVNIPIEFSDAGGGAATIANVKSNNILIIAMQGSAGATTSTIDGMFRIRYSDC